MLETIRVKLGKGAYPPNRAHKEDAGLDIRTPKSFTVAPVTNLGFISNGSAVIDTGVHVEIPTGYVGLLKSKSGLNVKFNLTGEGVIDAGYTGSIVVKLYNHGKEEVKFEKGDKIIQLLIMPVELPEVEIVEELDNTDRGENGFGSTGK